MPSTMNTACFFFFSKPNFPILRSRTHTFTHANVSSKIAYSRILFVCLVWKLIIQKERNFCLHTNTILLAWRFGYNFWALAHSHSADSRKRTIRVFFARERARGAVIAGDERLTCAWMSVCEWGSRGLLVFVWYRCRFGNVCGGVCVLRMDLDWSCGGSVVCVCVCVCVFLDRYRTVSIF